MARPKAIETENTEPEKLSKADELDKIIRDMIPRMAEGSSIDLDKHRIQASIFSRLESWAKKQQFDHTGKRKEGNIFERAGVENWDSILPKYVSLVSKVSDERSKAVEAIKARNAVARNRSIDAQVRQMIEGVQ